MIGELIGNYRVVRQIGAGGMGEVYLCEHQDVQTKIAVKILYPHISTRQGQVARFFNEARAVARIRHAGIVKIYDVGFTAHRQAYLLMELLEGESLLERIRRGPMAHSEVCEVARQIASVLAATHKAGIIHRDLKPDNVFIVPDHELDSGERIKVLDFGVAKLGDLLGPGRATQSQTTMGTPLYMPPEQAGDASKVDGRADIYSLGCIVFEMVCGRPPFQATSMVEALNRHLNTPPPSCSSIIAGVSPELDALVLRMLAKSPHDRPQTMQELTSAFTALRAAEPTEAGVAAASRTGTRRPAPPRSEDGLEPMPARGTAPYPITRRSSIGAADTERPAAGSSQVAVLVTSEAHVRAAAPPSPVVVALASEVPVPPPRLSPLGTPIGEELDEPRRLVLADRVAVLPELVRTSTLPETEGASTDAPSAEPAPSEPSTTDAARSDPPPSESTPSDEASTEPPPVGSSRTEPPVVVESAPTRLVVPTSEPRSDSPPRRRKALWVLVTGAAVAVVVAVAVPRPRRDLTGDRMKAEHDASVVLPGPPADTATVVDAAIVPDAPPAVDAPATPSLRERVESSNRFIEVAGTSLQAQQRLVSRVEYHWFLAELPPDAVQAMRPLRLDRRAAASSPVAWVAFEQARRFCTAIGAALPTDAQWLAFAKHPRRSIKLGPLHEWTSTESAASMVLVRSPLVDAPPKDQMTRVTATDGERASDDLGFRCVR